MSEEIRPVTIVLSCTLALTAIASFFLLTRGRAPMSWDKAEMARAAQSSVKFSPTQVQILNWSIKRRDGNPSSEMDEAIILMNGDRIGKTEFVLSHIWRDRSAPKPQWREEFIFDSLIPGSREFDHQPSPQEIRQFLQDTHWDEQ